MTKSKKNRNNAYIHVKYDALDRETVERERRERKRKKKEKKQGYSEERSNARAGRFDFDTINGFKLIDVEYTVPPKGERKRCRSAFNGVRSEFLKHIAANCEDALRNLGITDQQLQQIKNGRTPLGFNVHHKLPIHGGGKNEFSNLIFMPIPPHNELHHKVMDPQVCSMQEGESKKVKIPWSDNMVYVRPENDNTKNFDKGKKNGKIIEMACMRTLSAARR